MSVVHYAYAMTKGLGLFDIMSGKKNRSPIKVQPPSVSISDDGLGCPIPRWARPRKITLGR